MRIVLDTNILVRANIKAEGPAREALLKIISGNYVLITSPFLLREVERALVYPRFAETLAAQFAGYPGTRAVFGEVFRVGASGDWTARCP
jgi:predicted nucleic acid-binding protein